MLREGENLIHVIATDGCGNQGEDQICGLQNRPSGADLLLCAEPFTSRIRRRQRNIEAPGSNLLTVNEGLTDETAGTVYPGWLSCVTGGVDEREICSFGGSGRATSSGPLLHTRGGRESPFQGSSDQCRGRPDGDNRFTSTGIRAPEAHRYLPGRWIRYRHTNHYDSRDSG